MLEQWIESQARTRAGRLQSLRGQADNKIVGLPSSVPSEVEMLIKTNDLLVGDVLVDFETKSRKALSMIKTDDPYVKTIQIFNSSNFCSISFF